MGIQPAIATAVLALCLLGCADAVLEGPNYPAEGPPYIARDAGGRVPEFEIQQRLLMIGDAGYFYADDPVLAALGKWAGQVENSAVLFLGDNIYDDGLREDKREEAEQILSQQLSATDRLKILIPGNHDWGMNPKQQNLAAILNQQTFVDQWPAGNTRYGPRDGCMGPEAITLINAAGPDLVLVLMDPTPFLSPHLRELCASDSGDAAHFAQLEALLSQHTDDYVVAASHYPLLTGGPHGGLSYGGWKQVLVQLIGWAYGSLGNTYEPLYASWIDRVAQVFERYPPLLYAAGHDHNLQILEGGPAGLRLVVSGAGAIERVGTVTDLAETRFAHAAPGFVVLDLGQRDGEPVAALRVLEAGVSVPVFELQFDPRQGVGQ